MRRREERSAYPLRDALASCVVVACVFFYFLLFAQFALLHRIEELDAEKEWLQTVMLFMGIGGLLGSLLGAALFRIGRTKRLLSIGFFSCSALAFSAAAFHRIGVFVGLGFLVGIFLGILTVVVVPMLRLLIRTDRIGRWVGIGTGLAYFGSNLPVVFQPRALVQCLIAGTASVIGGLLVLLLPKALEGSRLRERLDMDLLSHRTAHFWSVLGFLFVLVWLDSAAFYAIQESSDLRDATWGTPSHLWGNAWVHLLLGVAIGFLLERRFLNLALGGAMVLLVGGCLWLRIGYEGLAWFGSSLYVAGVSLYSTVLVVFAAMVGERAEGWTIAKRAGLVFALAGWVASAMGIGMARDLGTVPYAFLVVSSIVALGCLVWGRMTRGRVCL